MMCIQIHITMLPPEIITQIINYLDIDDIINVLQISKIWFGVSKYNIQKRNLVTEYYQRSTIDHSLRHSVWKNLFDTISNKSLFGSYLIIISGLTLHEEIIKLSVSLSKPDVLEFMVESGRIANNVLIGYLLKFMDMRIVSYDTIKWLYMNYITDHRVPQRLWIRTNSKLTTLLVDEIIAHGDFITVMKRNILPGNLVHKFLLKTSEMNHSIGIKWCFANKLKYIIQELKYVIHDVFYNIILNQNHELLNDYVIKGFYQRIDKLKITQFLIERHQEECLEWAFINSHITRNELISSIIIYGSDEYMKQHIEQKKITEKNVDEIIPMIKGSLVKDMQRMILLINSGVFVMKKEHITKIFSTENPDTLRFIFDKYQRTIFSDPDNLCQMIRIISSRSDRTKVYNILIISILSIKENRNSERICQALMETYEPYVIKNLLWKKCPISITTIYLQKCLEYKKYDLFITITCDFWKIHDYCPFVDYFARDPNSPVLKHICYNCIHCYHRLTRESVELINNIHKTNLKK